MFWKVLAQMNPKTTFYGYTQIFFFAKCFRLRDIKHNSKLIKRKQWYTPGLLASSKKTAKLFFKNVSKPIDYNIKTNKTYNNMYKSVKRKMENNLL